jgi:Glycosyl hydrolases family 16
MHKYIFRLFTLVILILSILSITNAARVQALSTYTGWRLDFNGKIIDTNILQVSNYSPAFWGTQPDVSGGFSTSNVYQDGYGNFVLRSTGSIKKGKVTGTGSEIAVKTPVLFGDYEMRYRMATNASNYTQAGNYIPSRSFTFFLYAGDGAEVDLEMTADNNSRLHTSTGAYNGTPLVFGYADCGKNTVVPIGVASHTACDYIDNSNNDTFHIAKIIYRSNLLEWYIDGVKINSITEPSRIP